MSKLIVAAVTCALFVSSPWFDVSSAKAAGNSTVDSYITLNGTNYLNAADNNVWDFTGNMTMTAWIKPDASCVAASVLCMIVNKENSWEFAVNEIGRAHV